MISDSGAKCPFAKSSQCVMQEGAPVCDRYDEDVRECDVRQQGIEEYILPLLKRRGLHEGDQFFEEICRSFGERVQKKIDKNPKALDH